MILLDTYQIISGVSTLLIGVVLIVLVFKLAGKLIKSILSIVAIGLLIVAILLLVGVI